MITQEELVKLMAYEPDSGLFVYNIKTKNGKRKPGDIAGCVKSEGYIQIKIDGIMYYAHVLAWLYMTGHYCEKQIDHKDGNGLNNSWLNLRAATATQNQHNVGLRKDNTSGFKGVSFHKKLNKFAAYASIDGKINHLGFYNTAEEAGNAYVAATKEYHGEFAT